MSFFSETFARNASWEEKAADAVLPFWGAIFHGNQDDAGEES